MGEPLAIMKSKVSRLGARCCMALSLFVCASSIARTVAVHLGTQINVIAPTPTPSATPLLPHIDKGAVRIELEQVAGGLSAPNDLVSVGDGRLFVVEQTGTIRIVENGSLVATPFLDLSARLVALNPDYDERGLLGLAFHPGFKDPASPGFRKFYTYTSEPVSGTADFTVPKTGPFDHQSVVAEWAASVADPNVADPA